MRDVQVKRMSGCVGEEWGGVGLQGKEGGGRGLPPQRGGGARGCAVLRMSMPAADDGRGILPQPEHRRQRLEAGEHPPGFWPPRSSHQDRRFWVRLTSPHALASGKKTVILPERT